MLKELVDFSQNEARKDKWHRWEAGRKVSTRWGIVGSGIFLFISGERIGGKNYF